MSDFASLWSAINLLKYLSRKQSCQRKTEKEHENEDKQKNDPPSQQSSIHAGHDHSMAHPDPTVADNPKAPISNTETAAPQKEGADSGKHREHSQAQKTRL